ncbi:hypothetical protein [Amycolatopsis palatopharyngis]|uniref:hypothetical protein n=1 Tax=Amycolatopsis palatopharyngis TaxID=187982 RepID=UPI000E22876E|nr:hypothetical protein [Amycolatopsis palatopharyngis]
MTNSDNDETGENSARGPNRRDFFKTSAAFAGAAAGLAAFGGAPAFAAQSPRQIPSPPPLGAEIPCSCLAVNTPLTVRAATVTVDFRGEIRVRVEASDPLDPWSLRLKVIGHKVSANDNGEGNDPGSRQDQGLGEITIEQGDFETTPDSLVKMLSQSPPKWEQTMFLDFTMTIERPPEELMRRALGVSLSRAPEPLVLSTKEPGKLIGQLDNFPPKGEIYQLQNPINLVIPDNPDEVVASIDKFPVKVGGL